MLENVEVFCQSTIKMIKDKIIYFDPFKYNMEEHDADIIFITHDHYDHFDKESILKIKNDNTYIVIPSTTYNDALTIFPEDRIIVVEPNKDYDVLKIKFHTVNAYNPDKPYHPKENGWVGYVVYLDKVYYIMGDTSDTPEARNVSCDCLFIPIGGTYTMDYLEAATYTNLVKPKIAVPIHYGDIVGSKTDAENFINKLDSSITGIILKK